MSGPALVLAAHNVSVRQIARALDKAPTVISDMLRGRVRLNPAVVPVVRGLAGSDAAEQLVRAIERERIAAMTAASRREQGLPKTVTDSAALATVAELLDSPNAGGS